jgi:hypothetical protein
MGAEEKWGEVDRYLEDLYVGDDPALKGALDDSDAAGLPAIAVAPTTSPMSASAKRLTCSSGSSKRVPIRSTSSSSTPTRRRIRSIWSGHCG